MEAFFGQDLAAVRIHTTPEARKAAAAVDADALTVGHDVYVTPERYRPGSSAGRHLLAHELAHVVQQAVGPVEGTPGADGVLVSHPGDRFERGAEAAARLFTALHPPDSPSSVH
jgi:hypothetical protein